MAGHLNNFLQKFNKYLKTLALGAIFINLFLKTWNALSQASPSFNNFDSPSYFNFELFPAFRMQILTGIYTFIGDEQRIIEFQSLFSAVSWTYLAVALFVYFNYSWLSLIAGYMLTVLATSGVIQEHNFILSSESLNNSGIALFFGSLLLHYKSKTLITYLMVLISLFIIAGTKSSSAITVAFIAIVVILFEYFAIRRFNKLKIALSIVSIILISFFAATALSSDITKTLTTSGTINNRLWVDVDWREQVIDSGFPLSARKVWIAYSENNLGKPPDQAVVDLPEFKIWWNQGGSNFLNNFLIKNLDYTFIGSICLPCLNPTFIYGQTLLAGWSKGTNEYRNYASLSGVELSRTIFWPVKPEDSYFLLGLISLVILIALVVMIFSKNQKSEFLIKIYFITIGFVLVYSHLSWWFGSKPVDMTRHQLAGAISLRILAVISILFIISTTLDFVASKIQKVKGKRI